MPDSVERHLFTDSQRAFVEDYLAVVGSRVELEKRRIKAGTNLLLYGPPGSGKSHLAMYIAARLKLPIYVARLDGLISSFLREHRQEHQVCVRICIADAVCASAG